MFGGGGKIFGGYKKVHEKIVATFFLFYFFLGDSKKFVLCRGAKNFSQGAPNGKHG